MSATEELGLWLYFSPLVGRGVLKAGRSGPLFAVGRRLPGPAGGSLARMKIFFAPIGVVTGLLAGIAAQKAFERLWAVIDDEEPPAPDQRQVSIPKLVAALLVEGAIFRLVKGITDHGVRSGVSRLTGRWPGEGSAQAS
jgi:hypothetical protein